MLPARHTSPDLQGGRILPLVATAALAACGADSSNDHSPRSAHPVTVTAAIGEDSISLTPRRLGAGPVVLTVANRSSTAQAVTLDGDRRLTQTTSPLNPHGSARLAFRLARGTYELRTRDREIRPASLRVGRRR
jgi:hypothetical protein